VTTLLRLGRLDDACAELERMPGSYLLREDMVDLASRAWLWKREPERCLRVLNGWSEDFLGGRPKGLLIGQANALLKKHEAARLAWQAALGKVEQQIAETAGTTHTRPYLFFRAQLLAHLRDQARSEEAFHAVEQIGYPSTTRRAELLVVMGRPAEAVQSLWEVRARFRGGRVNMSSVSLGRAELRHDPIWDPIRADPRFQEVIALWERRIVRGDGTAEGLRR
jgi:hypothetical protein